MSFKYLKVSECVETANLKVGGRALGEIIRDAVGISDDLNLDSLHLSSGLFVTGGKTDLQSTVCSDLVVTESLKCNKDFETSGKIFLRDEKKDAFELLCIKSIKSEGSRLVVEYTNGGNHTVDLSSMCDTVKVDRGSIEDGKLILFLTDGNEINISLDKLQLESNTYAQSASLKKSDLVLRMNTGEDIKCDLSGISEFKELRSRKGLCVDGDTQLHGNLFVKGNAVDNSVVDVRMKGSDESVLEISLSDGRKLSQSLRDIRTTTGLSSVCLDDSELQLVFSYNDGRQVEVPIENAIRKALQNCECISTNKLRVGGYDLSSTLTGASVSADSVLHLQKSDGKVIEVNCSTLIASGVSGSYTDATTGQTGIILNDGKYVPISKSENKHLLLTDSLTIGGSALIDIGSKDVCLTSRTGARLISEDGPLVLQGSASVIRLGKKASLSVNSSDPFEMYASSGFDFQSSCSFTGQLYSSCTPKSQPSVECGVSEGDCKPVINLHFGTHVTDTEASIHFIKHPNMGGDSKVDKANARRGGGGARVRRALKKRKLPETAASIVCRGKGLLTLGSPAFPTQLSVGTYVDGGVKSARVDVLGEFRVNGAKVGRQLESVSLGGREENKTHSNILIRCSDDSLVSTDLLELMTNYDAVGLVTNINTGCLELRNRAGSVFSTDLTKLPKLGVEGSLTLCGCSLIFDADVVERSPSSSSSSVTPNTPPMLCNNISSTRALRLRAGNAAQPTELYFDDKGLCIRGASVCIRTPVGGSASIETDTLCISSSGDAKRSAHLKLTSSDSCLLSMGKATDHGGGIEYDAISEAMYIGSRIQAPSICIHRNGSVEMKRGLTVAGSKIKSSVESVSLENGSKLITSLSDGTVFQTDLSPLTQSTVSKISRNGDNLCYSTVSGDESTFADISHLETLTVDGALVCNQEQQIGQSLRLIGDKGIFKVNQEADVTDWVCKNGEGVFKVSAGEIDLSCKSNARVHAKTLVLAATEVNVPIGGKFVSPQIAALKQLTIPVLQSAESMTMENTVVGSIAYAEDIDRILFRTSKGVARISLEYPVSDIHMGETE